MLKERLMSDLLSFLAGAVLVFSALLYLVFVSRILAKAGGPLTFVAAWHLPLAAIAALLSLYAAVRRRSNLGLVLFVCSVIVITFYIFFTVS